jgi:sugar-specific transcriptional regulator TrmB
MQKDLVTKLLDFGFTINQAKVYLSIIESGSLSVAKIAQNTQLHVQDIYKILPKLEKMGLITKTIGKPVQIKAIPIEEALPCLVDAEKEKAQKRIGHLEMNLKDLTDSIKESRVCELEEDVCFVPLITAKQIKNQAESTFGKVITSCDFVVNIDLIKPLMCRLFQNIERFNNIGVKSRLIIESPSSPEFARAMLQQAIPKNVKLLARFVRKAKPTPFYVIDQNEAWISMERLTDAGLPCVLWTNEKNIVQLFSDIFEYSWNSPKAIRIYPLQELEINQTIVL